MTSATNSLFPRGMQSWIAAANRETTLIERMRALLRMDDSISFAELDQLDGFRGSQALTTEHPNLVIWHGISDQAIADLQTLIALDECHMAPASLLIYLADGRLPSLPIAKCSIGYTRPHWAPTMLRRGPAEAAPKPRISRPPAAPRKRRLVPGKLRVAR